VTEPDLVDKLRAGNQALNDRLTLIRKTPSFKNLSDTHSANQLQKKVSVNMLNLNKDIEAHIDMPQEQTPFVDPSSNNSLKNSSSKHQ
jgi:hypothetical protein